MTPLPASAHRLLSTLVFAVALGGPGLGCSGDGGGAVVQLRVGLGRHRRHRPEPGRRGLGTPVLATQQRHNNLKLSFGGAVVAPPFDPTAASLELVPLTEPIRPLANSYPSAYPANLYGESPHTAMADQLTALAMQEASRRLRDGSHRRRRVRSADDRHREEPDEPPTTTAVKRPVAPTTRPCSRPRRSPGWRGRWARATASAPSWSRTASPTPPTPRTAAISTSC